jgi:hypothetical protein
VIMMIRCWSSWHWLMPKIFRFVKRGFQALRDRMRAVKPDQPASTNPPVLLT